MWRVITSLTAMFGLLSGVHAADLAVVGTIDVAKVGAFKKPKKSFEQSHNMSGMFCPDADWCLVVSDELQGLHRLKVDRTGELPLLSYDTALTFDPPGQEFLTGHGMAGTDFEELDLEAIASDGDSVIFLGSHANKRNSGATNPTAHLVAIANTAALKTSATATPQWASLDKLFQKEGMFPDALYKLCIDSGVVTGRLIRIARMQVEDGSPRVAHTPRAVDDLRKRDRQCRRLRFGENAPGNGGIDDEFV